MNLYYKNFTTRISFDKIDWDTLLAWKVNAFIKNDLKEQGVKYRFDPVAKEWVIYKVIKENDLPKLHYLEESHYDKLESIFDPDFMKSDK